METSRTTGATGGVEAGSAASAVGPLPPSQFQGESMSAVRTANHFEPVAGINNSPDPTNVKDPIDLLMRAALKMSKMGVDNILAQIDPQVGRISSMRANQVPEAMIKEYTRQLDSLFDQADYDKKSAALVSSGDFLAVIHKVDLVKAREATSLRDRVAGGV